MKDYSEGEMEQTGNYKIIPMTFDFDLYLEPA